MTQSDFDHVAMILKFNSDMEEIYFIESTGTNGVSLNKWSNLRQIVGPNKFYRKVIFRHVNFPRTSETLAKLG